MTLTSGDQSLQSSSIKSETPLSPVSPAAKSSNKFDIDSIIQTLGNAKQQLINLQTSSSASPTTTKNSRGREVKPLPLPKIDIPKRQKDGLAEKGIKVDDKYNDPKTDLILVSSDGTGFMVQSIYVRAASKILNDKCLALVSSLSPDSTIDFDDPSIERATTIRFLLDFIHGDIPEPKHELLGVFRRAILLAQKYECKLVLSAMKTLAKTYHENGEIPFTVFVLGANLGDVQLCSNAIMDGDESPKRGTDNPPEWYDHDGDSDIDEGDLNEDDGEDGFEDDDDSTMDLTTWHTQDIQHVPAKYLAGLLRASRLRNQPGKDWYDVAHRFEELMSPIQKVDPSTKQKEKDMKHKGVVAREKIKDIKVKPVADGDTKKKIDAKELKSKK
ncbi:uncharacterized protein L199_001022 [Kwoniella botswanensis]|uniref:uncharacterized protein n=1 Tax=Kwoniella botswanensis TaxID=1268659 RepID=UPI00315C57DD